MKLSDCVEALAGPCRGVVMDVEQIVEVTCGHGESFPVWAWAAVFQDGEGQLKLRLSLGASEESVRLNAISEIAAGQTLVGEAGGSIDINVSTTERGA